MSENICKKCKYLCREYATCVALWERATPHRLCYLFTQLTNADHIRNMSDEDLTAFLHRCICEDGAPAFCRGLPECESDMDADSLIPLERCCQCLLYWLKSPYSASYWSMHRDNGKKEDNHE